MPTRGQRPAFGFAISDHATYDQIGVIESSSISVRDGIPEFSAFMNRSRSFRRNVAGNSTGKRELLEEMQQAFRVLRDVRIHFAVGAFEIGICHQAGATMSRAGAM